MVEQFNDPKSHLFAFLLSSKAGGCGLNLIGGNRLVLFDPDWNPANDKQAAARVWRDGQKKKCVLYRMLCAGSIEEKVFERQLSKEGLSGIATAEKIEEATMCKNELRDLFALHDDMPSHLHHKLMVEKNAAMRGEIAEGSDDDDDDDDDVGGGGKTGGKKGKGGGADQSTSGGGAARADGMSAYYKEQEGWPKETGDMHLWGHHLGTEKVDDPVLRDAAKTQYAGEGTVSFVFSLQVQGKLEVKGSQPAVAVVAPTAKGWLHHPKLAAGQAGAVVGGAGAGRRGDDDNVADADDNSEHDSDDDNASDMMDDEGGGSDGGAASDASVDDEGDGAKKGRARGKHTQRAGGAKGGVTRLPPPGPPRPSGLLSRAPPAAPQVAGKLKVAGDDEPPAQGGKENATVRPPPTILATHRHAR